jgi:UDP-GlcNAc:undecaprenyl-phosphate GlcNAc-1-phosphate transferase
MFGIGLVDDVWPTRAATKLLLQCAIAILMVVWMPTMPLTGIPAVDFAFSVVWIVGVTNAFNLLDNMDGLAAGVAAIAAMFLLLVLWREPAASAWPIAVGAMAVIGVAIGFLVFNFQPATIFMGDSGSHLLGSVLSGLSLLACPDLHAKGMPAPTMAMTLLAIPIFDTTFVTVTRRLMGRSVFIGGRDHTSHRLVAMGLHERGAVLTLYALAAAGGGVCLGFTQLPAGTALVSAMLFVGTLVLLGVSLAQSAAMPSLEIPRNSSLVLASTPNVGDSVSHS